MKFIYHKINISEVDKWNIDNTPEDPRRDMTKDVEASLNNNE